MLIIIDFPLFLRMFIFQIHTFGSFMNCLNMKFTPCVKIQQKSESVCINKYSKKVWMNTMNWIKTTQIHFINMQSSASVIKHSHEPYPYYYINVGMLHAIYVNISHHSFQWSMIHTTTHFLVASYLFPPKNHSCQVCMSFIYWAQPKICWAKGWAFYNVVYSEKCIAYIHKQKTDYINVDKSSKWLYASLIFIKFF